MGTVTLGLNLICLDFPKDRDQITEIKRIPGARWNPRDRVWTVPVAQVHEVREFAARHNFDVDPEVLRLNVPKRRPADVTIDGDVLRVRFDYDPVLVNRVKAITGAKWDPASKTWTTPKAAAEETLAFAESSRLAVHPDVKGLAAAAAEQKAMLTAASRAVDDVEIDLPVETPFPLKRNQRLALDYIAKIRSAGRPGVLVGASPGLGKGQPADTPILTPGGWKSLGDVQVGDLVVGSDGKPTRVIGVFPRGVQQVYEIEFSDGVSTTTDAEHLWTVRNTNDNKKRLDRWTTLSTEEMYLAGPNHYLLPSRRRRWFVPMVEPVSFDDPGPLPLDPYLLGVILGDGGTTRNVVLHLNAEDAEAILRRITLPEGDSIHEVNSHSSGGRDFSITGGATLGILRNLGLKGQRSWEKHVPEMYLRANPADRLALLQGLMDTDGTPVKKGGGTEFSTSSEALAFAVIDLVQGLGGVAKMRPRVPHYTYKGERLEGRVAYRINAKLPTSVPFSIPRKTSTYQAPTKYPPQRSIARITPTGERATICISVEAVDQLYVTEHYLVTHNTCVSLMALEREQAFPAVIVCPATLKLNWQREAKMWLPHRTVEVVTGRDPHPVLADIVIVNYDILAPAPKRGTTPEKGATGVTFGRGGKVSAGEAWCKEFAGFKAVVFDESTAIKEFTAARTKGALHIVKNLAPNALRLALTGTPLKNRTSEFAAQLDAVGALKDFGGAWGFYKGACGAYQDKWGHWVKDGNPSEKKLRELNDKLRTLGYIRQTKEEFLDDLAPVEHQVQWVDGDPKVMREYAKAEADLIQYLVERAKEIAKELGLDVRSAAVSARMKAEAAQHLVRLSTLRQITARAKTEAAAEFIQERLEADLQVVVAAHHRDVVDLLSAPHNDVKIQGGMKSEDIEDHKAKFQAGDHKVIVLSIQAAGMGHTLTAAQDVLFVELPWSPADVEQTYSRCHRIGQQGSVTATYLLIPNTIDEEIWDMLQGKQATITAAVEGTKKQKTTSTSDLVDKYLQIGLQ